jgi:hypothetical protein
LIVSQQSSLQALSRLSGSISGGVIPFVDLPRNMSDDWNLLGSVRRMLELSLSPSIAAHRAGVVARPALDHRDSGALPGRLEQKPDPAFAFVDPILE